MNILKSEKGSITVFIILSFLFMMAILFVVYWKSNNYQISVLQVEGVIKETYGEDVNNVNEIYNNLTSGQISI